MPTPEFILDLRRSIGHAPLWLPGVKGVVLRTDGERPSVLLVRRADNGLWTLPAGILEPGEEPADGIEREVLEETGVRARAERIVGVSTTDPVTYPNGDRAQFLDTIVALTPLTLEAHVADDENLDVAWRSVDSLGDLPPRHRRAVEWALAQGGREGGNPVPDAAWFVRAGLVSRGGGLG